MATSVSTKNSTPRAEIIAAGSRLIAEKGFNAITLQDVLDTAGVTKGKFFHYFHSKDEFFSALLREALSSRGVILFQELLTGCKSNHPFDQLLYILDRHIAWHSDGLPEGLRLCLFATFFFPPRSPELLQINEIMSSNAAVLEKLVRASQDCGTLPKSIDAKIFSLLIPSVSVGGNIIGFLSGRKDLSVENLKETRKLLVAFAEGAPSARKRGRCA